MTVKTYAIMNRKGGVGKTTTAVTIATEVARRLRDNGGGYVLLIDIDPQGNVCHSLGITSKNATIADVLTGRATLKETLVSGNQENGGVERPNLYILPANDNLQHAKNDLIALSVSAAMSGRKGADINDVLVNRLGKAKNAFSYVFVDCPPSLDSLSEAVFRFVDGAIVPVKVDYLGTTGTAHHTQNILQAQAAGIDIRIERIVPTFYRSREKLCQAMYDALKKAYGKRLVADPIPQAAVVEQAPASSGMTVIEFDPTSKPAEAYMKLVDTIM
jgi:chromosome partitioning protein